MRKRKHEGALYDGRAPATAIDKAKGHLAPPPTGIVDFSARALTTQSRKQDIERPVPAVRQGA
jgi:hypothetical protein